MMKFKFKNMETLYVENLREDGKEQEQQYFQVVRDEYYWMDFMNDIKTKSSLSSKSVKAISAPKMYPVISIKNIESISGAKLSGVTCFSI